MMHEYFKNETRIRSLKKDPEDVIDSSLDLSHIPVSKLPFIPPSKRPGQDEINSFWKKLRSFYQSGTPFDSTGLTGGDLYPASVYSTHLTNIQASEFPFWISSKYDHSKQEPTTRYSSLYRLIQIALSDIKEESESFKLLESGILRFEADVDQQLKLYQGTYSFLPVIEQALENFKKQLKLSNEELQTFEIILHKFKSALPKDGFLLPFSPLAYFYILDANVKNLRHDLFQSINMEIRSIQSKLEDLIAVELEKQPQAKNPENIASHLNIAESFLDFDKLSSVLPEEGSEIMPKERFSRIQKILLQLDKWQSNVIEKKPVLLLSSKVKPIIRKQCEEIFKDYEIINGEDGHVCNTASEVFEKHFKSLVDFFIAVKKANLEISNQYDTDLHEAYFHHFTWQSLEDQEYMLCPPMFVMMGEDEIVLHELKEFSQNISKQLPVKWIVLRDNQVDKQSDAEDKISFRQELGALTIAHRNCFFMQGSAISPSFLSESIRDGIISFTPAVFYFNFYNNNDFEEYGTIALQAGSIESREFPNFSYHGHLDDNWGSRFHISHNPQIDLAWPVHNISYLDENQAEKELKIEFTFADYASQISQYHPFFMPVEPGYWTDDLVPLSDYLSGNVESNFLKVPFIWMVDSSLQLQKVALSWQMVFHCKERLDFWHYLQESSGVQNFHVQKAIEKLKIEYDENFNKKLEELRILHTKELEIVKNETASQAMDNLAGMLLDIGSSGNIVEELIDEKKTTTSVGRMPESSEKDKPENTDELQKEQDTSIGESVDYGEVWIETELCTSCDECTDINKNIFKYNESKKAYVFNPAGGPFADIVEAAENCPVGIIHPGSPMNKTEENLESLIERAKAYN